VTELRAARPQDYDVIIAAVDDWWGRPVASSLPRLFLDYFAASSRVIEDAEVLAAFLVGFMAPPVGYVHFVGVRPDLRGHGLARALYDDFAVRAAAAGCTELRAITSPANLPSRDFHVRMGFEVELAPEHNGPGRPALRFRRPL
jgi:ribosomal protein S18 acetylase RimI-like enzyme